MPETKISGQQDPVFIVGAHKSGSSFIRSLLDGHPELAVLPIESHFFRNLGYWVHYKFRRSKPSSKSFVELAIETMYDYKHNVNPYKDFHNLDAIDLDVFNNEIQKIKAESSERELFFAYTQAIFMSLSLDPKQNRIVEKSVENAEFVQDVKRIFPNAKTIHIIRNPYSNLASFRRYQHKMNGKYPLINKTIESLSNHYYFLEKNLRNFPRDYFVVRYEDLVTDTSGELKKICNFLGIDFSNKLLETTSGGADWKGNSTNNFNQAPTDISPFEVMIVNKFLSHVVDKYEYKRIYSKQGISYWKPNKDERLVTYLLNRGVKYTN